MLVQSESVVSHADSVRWGDTDLHYAYHIRPKRRTLAITVHPDLRIVVTAPDGVTPEAIRGKVLKRARWIHKVRLEFERFHPLQPPRSYVPGETHRYLGRQCRLKVVHGPVPSVALARGQMVITTPDKPTPRVLKALLDRWLLERAREIFNERLLSCHHAGRRYRIPLPELWIRPLTSRWGSLTPAGRIILNCELIKAPRECIDYVITHELCHLIEPNHNARFWQLLSALMPDWEERRGRLNHLADI